MDTELSVVYKELRERARTLGAYEEISVDELANKYCELTDNHKEYERDVYFSALVLRFWYKIHKLYVENTVLNLSHTDYYCWVVDAIMMACAKDARKWQTDLTINAQQAINQVLATRFKAAAYYESNLQKNQGRHLETSLDEPIVSDEEGTTLADIIPDESSPADNDNSVTNWIQEYVNNNKVIEAIILDTIASKDVYKHTKRIIKNKDENGKVIKHTEHSSSFWPFQLVRELCALNDDYADYFLSAYKISPKMFDAAFNTLKKANNQKKYKMVSATLTDFKKYITGNLALGCI